MRGAHLPPVSKDLNPLEAEDDEIGFVPVLCLLGMKKYKQFSAVSCVIQGI